jgi:hypothetical protein
MAANAGAQCTQAVTNTPAPNVSTTRKKTTASPHLLFCCFKEREALVSSAKCRSKLLKHLAARHCHCLTSSTPLLFQRSVVHQAIHGRLPVAYEGTSSI